LHTIYEQIFAEHKRIEKEIKTLYNQIETLPKGILLCKTNGNYTKWYKKDDNKLTYLRKNQRSVAERLATKKYLTLLLNELLHEKKSLELYLSHHITVTPRANHLLNQTSAYHELLEPHFKPFSIKVLEWINSPYEHNTKHPENLIHKSLSGNTVRSKSEAIIDMALYMNEIPYRYECALYLDHLVYFPDFMIYHPQSGKLYYWEHFGMMDNPTYSKDVYNKLQTYNDYGYITSINLITTFETKANIYLLIFIL
jgi:hypothetical protein